MKRLQIPSYTCQHKTLQLNMGLLCSTDVMQSSFIACLYRGNLIPLASCSTSWKTNISIPTVEREAKESEERESGEGKDREGRKYIYIYIDRHFLSKKYIKKWTFPSS